MGDSIVQSLAVVLLLATCHWPAVAAHGSRETTGSWDPHVREHTSSHISSFQHANSHDPDHTGQSVQARQLLHSLPKQRGTLSLNQQYQQLLQQPHQWQQQKVESGALRRLRQAVTEPTVVSEFYYLQTVANEAQLASIMNIQDMDFTIKGYRLVNMPISFASPTAPNCSPASTSGFLQAIREGAGLDSTTSITALCKNNVVRRSLSSSGSMRQLQQAGTPPPPSPDAACAQAARVEFQVSVEISNSQLAVIANSMVPPPTNITDVLDLVVKRLASASRNQGGCTKVPWYATKAAVTQPLSPAANPTSTNPEADQCKTLMQLLASSPVARDLVFAGCFLVRPPPSPPSPPPAPTAPPEEPPAPDGTPPAAGPPALEPPAGVDTPPSPDSPSPDEPGGVGTPAGDPPSPGNNELPPAVTPAGIPPASTPRDGSSGGGGGGSSSKAAAAAGAAVGVLAAVLLAVGLFLYWKRKRANRAVPAAAKDTEAEEDARGGDLERGPGSRAGTPKGRARGDRRRSKLETSADDAGLLDREDSGPMLLPSKSAVLRDAEASAVRDALGKAAKGKALKGLAVRDALLEAAPPGSNLNTDEEAFRSSLAPKFGRLGSQAAAGLLAGGAGPSTLGDATAGGSLPAITNAFKPALPGPANASQQGAPIPMPDSTAAAKATADLAAVAAAAAAAAELTKHVWSGSSGAGNGNVGKLGSAGPSAGVNGHISKDLNGSISPSSEAAGKLRFAGKSMSSPGASGSSPGSLPALNTLSAGHPVHNHGEIVPEAGGGDQPRHSPTPPTDPSPMPMGLPVSSRGAGYNSNRPSTAMLPSKSGRPTTALSAGPAPGIGEGPSMVGGASRQWRRRATETGSPIFEDLSEGGFGRAATENGYNIYINGSDSHGEGRGLAKQGSSRNRSLAYRGPADTLDNEISRLTTPGPSNGGAAAISPPATAFSGPVPPSSMGRPHTSAGRIGGSGTPMDQANPLELPFKSKPMPPFHPADSNGHIANGHTVSPNDMRPSTAANLRPGTAVGPRPGTSLQAGISNRWLQKQQGLTIDTIEDGPERSDDSMPEVVVEELPGPWMPRQAGFGVGRLGTAKSKGSKGKATEQRPVTPERVHTGPKILGW